VGAFARDRPPIKRGQVDSIEQFYPGLVIRLHHLNKCTFTEGIVSRAPFITVSKTYNTNYLRYVEIGDGSKRLCSLSDYCVEPTQYGLWAQINWIERISLDPAVTVISWPDEIPLV
jgi:hypothetical protein